MNQYFLHMTASQQVGALFILVFGVLLIASITVFSLSIREFSEGDPVGEARQKALKEYNSVLNASWVMMVVFWVAWAAGDTVATVLFGLVAFFTLSPTRRGDHRSLVLAFFVVLPVQFALVAWRQFDLFTVFIPVYVFLLIPVVSALADDPHRFLERNAKLQWGIMVCVYGISHVPALLLLEFPQREAFAGRSAFLVFFLVLSVQICMVVQHFAAIQLKAAPTAPNISKSFSWRAWLSGVLASGILGGLFAGITPFAPGQAMAMALIACAAGSLGHLVMKALKRDRGVTNWGSEGKSVTGAGGLLDRVDALCFAAPVFFHSVRWYFGL